MSDLTVRAAGGTGERVAYEPRVPGTRARETRADECVARVRVRRGRNPEPGTGPAALSEMLIA